MMHALARHTLALVCSSLLVGTCIFTGSAAASEASELATMSLEELMNVTITTATLREESLQNASLPMYVVTAEQIKERRYSTLKDVMDDIPGYVDVSDTNENIAGIRGAFASTTNKILIMVNGHRMNSLSLGRYNTDQFFAMDSVERIEFVMGPGSVLYGTGALVGVVNIITKQGADAEGLYVRGSLGEFHDEGSISFGKSSEDFDVFFNFAYLDGDGGEIPQPATLDVVPEGQTRAPGKVYWNRYPDNWSALLSLRYRNTELHIYRAHASRATPRVPNGSFYDYEQEEATGWPPLYEQDDFFIDLETQLELGDATTLVINPSYHHTYLSEHSWITQYASNRMPPLGSRSGQDSKEDHWQLKSYVDHAFSDSVDAILGLDILVADFTQSNGFLISDGTVQSIPGRADLDTWPLVGAFAQLSWRPVDKLEITSGLRYDDFDDMADPKLTSRLGAVYHPSDQWTIKGLYGESYLSPQWEHLKMNTELFTFVSNPDIEPEELRSGDLIVQYQKSTLCSWVDLFVHDIDGIISPITSQGMQLYSNLGHSQYWGAEMGVISDLGEKWRLFGSYSFVRDTGESDDQFIQDGEIKNVPQHILRYGVRYEWTKDLTLNLWGRSYSEVRTSDSVTGDTTISPWTQLDFVATYAKNHLELQFKVVNLLDTDYEVGGTVTRPLARYGRGCSLSVGYYF
jgi:outer membrane receptor protein involved in Fe transport